MQKIVFFDIDGTLITYPDKRMPESTKKALTLLRKNGVLVYIATGRAYWYADFMNDYFDFDGYVCCNGQYCIDKNEKILYRKNISTETVDDFITYAQETNECVAFIDDEARYALGDWPYQKTRPATIIPADILRKKHIMTINIYTDVSKDKELQKRFNDCQFVRWTENFADVYSIDGGKEVGIQRVLDLHDIDIKNAIAIGDGGNDVSMLKYVPNSVAMGNAQDFVKESARYITDSIEEDGVYKILKKLELI